MKVGNSHDMAESVNPHIMGICRKCYIKAGTSFANMNTKKIYNLDCILAAEMRFLRHVAGYTLHDHRRTDTVSYTHLF